jgi:L-fuconolactonase
MSMNRRIFVAQASTVCLEALSFRSGLSVSKGLAKPQPLMIDAHVHVYKRDPAFPFAAGQKVPKQDYPVVTLLALMKANGVARTVLIQIIRYKWDNSYLARVLGRYPNLFQGVCRVNPEDPAAPDHLTQLTEDGFRGVRLSPGAGPEGDWILGPLMRPLWRRCAELKVPMTILTSVSRLRDLVPLIEANPTLDVVIDHMAVCPLGNPEQLRLLLELARFPRVYVKISELWAIAAQPYPYLDTQDRVRRLVDAFGPNRLMWATNWPVSLQKLPYARAVELYRNHMPYLSLADHQQILSKTALTLWPFPALTA